ncbi:MAG: ABC transporter ATP-binding protein [Oligoflexia bacterium]|nr:ABC transporter ATP-binding protein [Oligoflexia bacterium]
MNQESTKSLAIQIKDLQRCFGAKQVLNNINININSGEIVLLRGSNGAGKTTLLRILATLLKPTKGDAWLNGYSVIKEPLKAKVQMGWISSTQSAFFPRLNGLQNLYLFGSFYKLDKNAINRKIKTWEQVTPFTDALKTPFYVCSAGMKHSLNLFRGILHDPSILFLDEPGLHLDSKSTEILKSFFTQNKHKKTILFSAHEHNFLSSIASRCIELKNGGLFDTTNSCD